MASSARQESKVSVVAGSLRRSQRAGPSRRCLDGLARPASPPTSASAPLRRARAGSASARMLTVRARARASAAAGAQAYELVEAAEKRLKAFVMPLIGSKDAKFEDAAELFQKAGNAFKVAKNYEEAGAAFKNAAGCFQKIGSQHEAATAFQEAGNAFKKASPAQAIEMLKLTIELLSDIGRFSQVRRAARRGAARTLLRVSRSGVLAHGDAPVRE